MDLFSGDAEEIAGDAFRRPGFADAIYFDYVVVAG